MGYFAHLAACAILFHLSLAENTCEEHFQAISIPIRNVTLEGQMERRGIALSFGTPPQPLALMFTAEQNNTYLWDTSTSCAQNLNSLQCSTLHGFDYRENISSTWLFAVDIGAAGASNELHNTLADSNIWSTDSLVINSSLNISDFPLAISRTSPPYMNAVGLGRNSTILNALIAAKAIGSKTFGLFYGWVGADSDHQVDGNLVLGGYDAAKVTGENVTIPFTNNEACPSGLVIEISNISMPLANGSNLPIFGTSENSLMKACIEPQSTLIEISSNIYQNFFKIAGGTRTGVGNRSSSFYNSGGMLFEAEGVYTGGLSFTISPGLTITVPNHQLVVPDYGISEAGIPLINNISTREILLHSLEGANEYDLPLFGATFMTSAYLLVDQDKEEFTLWQSNAQSDKEQLVEIRPNSTCISAASPDGPSKSHLSRIVSGAVVGGLALYCICLTAAVMWKRRKPKPRGMEVHSECSITPEEHQKLREQLPVTQPQELLADTVIAELESTVTAELESNEVGKPSQANGTQPSGVD